MSLKPAISSMSLGRCWAGHNLEHKLYMASKYGLTGIEIFYEDLEDLVRTPGSPPPSADALHKAAREIYGYCESFGLSIICLQPFMHYDGLKDRSEHSRRVSEMKVWIQLAKVLHTDIIQVPSSFLPADQIDPELIVSDLQEVADLGLQQSPSIRFAYESLAWGTYVDTWEVCWDIVTRVDRPNFGICLDSFNIAGRIYADPASPTGCTPNAEAEMQASMGRLLATVDVRKVFFIQIVDAERLQQPLLPGHVFYNAEQSTRMSWSRNCRLFYGEEDRGAYLPVKEITKTLIRGLGYRGWVSMELFNRVMSEEGDGVPEHLAQRASEAWRKIVEDLNLEKIGSVARDPAKAQVAREGAQVARL